MLNSRKRLFSSRLLALAVATALTATGIARAADVKDSYYFDLGTDTKSGEHTPVPADMSYSAEKGFGFERGAQVKAAKNGEHSLVTSDKAFSFSVALPEGAYDVTVVLGNPDSDSDVTVKSETRRLMLEKVKVEKGKTVEKTFTAHIRTPAISTGGDVKLKDREKPALHWDNKLTIEFLGEHPSVQSIEIKPSKDVLTVYLAGDSTVTDQGGGTYNSWGQMLPRFFKPGVAVANYAESGESLPSSRGARRFDKILSTLKQGDYVFIQFGHNDEKDKSGGNIAMNIYKPNIEKFVEQIKAKGGIPVVVTPMERQRMKKETGKNDATHGQFPEAAREAAKDQNAALIDLTKMSVTLYEAIGFDDIKKAFATGADGKTDATHHNAYGSYELAKCIIMGIKEDKLDLAKFIVSDFQDFDPAKPDPVAKFVMPGAGESAAPTPDGN